MSKPHCFGKMEWVLKYDKENIPKTSICNCIYKNRCLEITLNAEDKIKSDK